MEPTAAQEQTVYTVILGGGAGTEGLKKTCPRNVAVGYHSALLPIVVTVLGLGKARKVEALNEKLIGSIQDPGSDDPSSLLRLFRDSRSVTRIFPLKKLKIYAVKAGILTGIWYGADWNTTIVPLIKHPKSEARKCDSFLQALEWMLQKAHMIEPIEDDDIIGEEDVIDEDDIDTEDDPFAYFEDITDPTAHPLPRRPTALVDSAPDPFGESVSRAGSPIKECWEQRHSTSPAKQPSAREPSPTKQHPVYAATTPSRAPSLVSPTKGKHVSVSRAPSPTKASFAPIPIKRSSSVPPPYAGRSYATSSIRFAAGSVSVSSTHGMHRPQGLPKPSALSDLEVVEISDNEVSVEQRLPDPPSAETLQRLIRKPAIDHDGALILGDAAVDLGEKAEAWLLGRRTSSAHRILILRAFVHTMTTDQFAVLVTREPLCISPDDSAKLWEYISYHIAPM